MYDGVVSVSTVIEAMSAVYKYTISCHKNLKCEKLANRRSFANFISHVLAIYTYTNIAINTVSINFYPPTGSDLNIGQSITPAIFSIYGIIKSSQYVWLYGTIIILPILCALTWFSCHETLGSV